MIYVDVTRTLEWSGRYTGMERFAYKIAEGLAQHDDVRLCAYVMGGGFRVLPPEAVSFDNQRLTSDIMVPRTSIRAHIKHPRIVVGEIRRRRRQSTALQQLKPVPTRNSVLVIPDGLWHDQQYTQAVIDAAHSGIKIAQAVHDLVPVVVPQVVLESVTHDFDRYFTQVAPYVDHFLPISKNTQDDYMLRYGSISKKDLKITLVRHGDDLGKVKGRQPKFARNLKKFLLTVGTVEIRKNHQLIYQAYRLAHERGIDLPPIVIVGRSGWMAESTMRAMQGDPVVQDKFIFAGPVDDKELTWLYEHCLFSMFVPIYEGWGLPIAESLRYGKLCITTPVSSIPEIAGDLLDYVSPYDPAELVQLMDRYCSDSALLDKKTAHMVANYKGSEWEDTSRTIYSAMSEYSK